jgi:hypothetical protein
MNQLSALADHGTYQGTQTIKGIECHVIYVDDPTKVDPQLSEGDAVTYYIGVSDSLMHGMDMSIDTGANMKMRMVDYNNHDGILYPDRIETTMVQMDAARKQQLEQLQEQMKQMPESVREQMKTQIEQAMGALSGEPMVVETKEVVVNGPLPAGIFDD